MAEVDYFLANWITNNLIYFVIGAVFVWFLWGNINKLRNRWFAYFMYYINKQKNEKLIEVKKDFFSNLGSITSHDPELRKRNALKILEIGVGTGVNFEYYPDGCNLVVVDPNPYFAQYYDDNRKKFPNISSEKIIRTTGEEMASVDDNSVDVVVMTLVLCSVDNTEKIMQQILRVLVPGGKFYFMEHIREFDGEKHGIRQKLQDFLTISRIWPFLLDGCCLNRDMLPAIKAAGFTKVNAEHFYAPMEGIMQLIKPHLKGIAEK